MPTKKNADRQKATQAELIAEIELLERKLTAADVKPSPGSSPLFGTVLDSLPVGIAYVDRNKTYQFANDHYRKLVNFYSGEIIGRHMNEVLSAKTYNVTKDALDIVLRGTPIAFENVLTVGNRDRILKINYLPDIKADADVAGFFAMVHDVTTQHHLQNELAGSERRYLTLVDTVPLGIEEIDIDGNILFANATHHRQYGYDTDELIGMNITELLPDGEDPSPLLLHLKYLAKEQPSIEPYFGKKIKKNGDLIDVKIVWTYKRDSQHNVIGFTTVIADITDQIKTERVQKENAARLELSLRSANIGTFSSNIVEGRSFWDDRMHDIWGLPRGSFVDHKSDEFETTLHTEDRERVLNAIKNTLEYDAPFDMEYRIFRPDGSVAYVEVLASVERDTQGQAIRLSGVTLDISERKLIENMKNDFVSTVSHELRTPLTSIRGALGLVTGGALGNIPHEALELIKLAENNATTLTKLVNDILDFERADSGNLELNFERFNLIDFIEGNLQSNQGLADKHDVRFQFLPVETEIEIEADSDRLAQVMANLLSNAAKYSPAGETIEIDVRTSSNSVEVFVSDKGPGIPIDFQDKVFGRFTQANATDDRNFGGAGLGLSITKLIIDHHQGEIDFVSSAETGTQFRFKLPRPLSAQHSQ